MSEDELIELTDGIIKKNIISGNALLENEITRTHFDELILPKSKYWVFYYKDGAKIVTEEFEKMLTDTIISFLMIDDMEMFVDIFEKGPKNKGKKIEDEVERILESLAKLDKFEDASQLKITWEKYKEENGK